jgi:DNA-3-methyladenine glycosylase
MSGTSLRTGPIVIRAGSPVDDSDVVVTGRIGITKAADWPLRYFVKDDPYVSATPPSFARLSYTGQGHSRD